MKFAKKLLPDLRFYSEARDMLSREDKLDAVYVAATPISSHLPIVEEIVASGRKIGVFVEKPLAGTSEEVKRIVERSNSIGKMNMIGFQKRFLSQLTRAKSLLD